MRKNAKELLDIYYLDMRSALLETAATFDRLERAEGFQDIKDDPRLQKLNTAIEILKNSNSRAEDFLMHFSEEGE